MNAKKATIVLVYGTLRKGGHNHGLLATATPLGNGIITDPCRMAHLGGFPAICDGVAGDYCPVVEAYAIDADTERRLDILEGVPHLYTRTTMNALINDQPIKALVYVMSDPNDTVILPEVDGGDWITAQEKANAN